MLGDAKSHVEVNMGSRWPAVGPWHLAVQRTCLIMVSQSQPHCFPRYLGFLNDLKLGIELELTSSPDYSSLSKILLLLWYECVHRPVLVSKTDQRLNLLSTGHALLAEWAFSSRIIAAYLSSFDCGFSRRSHQVDREFGSGSS